MRYLYYPGCSAESSSKSYEISAQAVGNILGVEMETLEDWNCCGATFFNISAHTFASYALSARNLALVEKGGEKQVLTVCPACHMGLEKTTIYVNEHPEIEKIVNAALGEAGLSYKGGVKTRHLLEVFYNDVGLDKIKEKVKKSLNNLKVAAYSGCQLTRPLGDFDNFEYPNKLDELVTALGGQVVDFSRKARCCGGMSMTSSPEIALKLSKDILEETSRKGADLIITVCPLCQMNLEGYQEQINKKYGKNYNMPILFFTQLMGLALGLSEKELELKKNLTDAGKILQTVG